MIITAKDLYVGYRAKAHALLLYYEIVSEDGFTNDQTVCIDKDHFDPFEILEVKVEKDLDIDVTFLREAAIIFLLCDLGDEIANYEDDFWLQPHAKRIIECYKDNKFSSMPETVPLLENIVKHRSMSFTEHRWGLKKIYEKYVLGRIKWIASEEFRRKEVNRESFPFVNLEDEDVA